MNQPIEHIAHAGKLVAIIIPSSFRGNGIEFFTPNEFSQQLAYMNRPAGYRISPHVHKPVPREVRHTLEVVFIRSGKVAIDFYNEGQEFLGQRVLGPGDAILLVSGGHGFKMLEPTEMIEVKQGPYAGEEDKTRFDGIEEKGWRS